MKWRVFGFAPGALRFVDSVKGIFVSISISPCVSSIILAGFLDCSGWSEVDVRPELRPKKKTATGFCVTGSKNNRDVSKHEPASGRKQNLDSNLML